VSQNIQLVIQIIGQVFRINSEQSGSGLWNFGDTCNLNPQFSGFRRCCWTHNQYSNLTYISTNFQTKFLQNLSLVNITGNH